LKITWLGENDLVDSEELVEANDGKANATGDLLPVCEHKGDVFFLPSNTNLFKSAPGNPAKFTPGINQCLGYDR